jgi:hypothetical protein
MHHRRLPVDGRRAFHDAARCEPERLVPEADAEHRRLFRKDLEQPREDSGILGATGAG